MVYKLSCSGCTSTYVGQTVRHLATRIEEHKKADSPVGLHLQQCQLEGNSADLSWEIIDRSNNQTKFDRSNKKFARGNSYQERETGLEHARRV